MRKRKGFTLSELPSFFASPAKVKVRIEHPQTGKTFTMQKTFYLEERADLVDAIIEWLKENQIPPSSVRSILVYL